MTQRDIEPLREICLDLGISALMARLEDVKLSISFQSLPSVKEQEVSDSPQRPPNCYNTEEEEEEEKVEAPSSCKFQQQPEKQKLNAPKGPTEEQVPRQYTVVSKMPKDTKLQVSTKCPKCELKFFKPEILEEHLKLHEGKKAKQCSICHKSFNSNYHFKTHMRTHSHVKPFCCAFKDCRKEFVDSSSLRRHQATHSGEKGFKCSSCGKGFTDRSSRKRHERMHVDPVSITCSLCSKNFTRRSQLMKHMIKTHPSANIDDPSTETDKSGAALNECPECKAVFKRPSKLAQHMMVHSGLKPYECDQCDKSFARKTNLQLHQRTHTGEKPHACARCGRCFSDVSAFRRHCRTHTGERPYNCSLCGAAFTQASTLYNHSKTCKRKRFNSTESEVEKLKKKCFVKDS